MRKIKKIDFETESKFELLMAFRKYRELKNNYEILIEEFQKMSGFATDTDRKNKMLEAEKERLEKEIRKVKTALKKYTEAEELSKKDKEELQKEMPQIPTKKKECKAKKSSR